MIPYNFWHFASKAPQSAAVRRFERPAHSPQMSITFANIARLAELARMQVEPAEAERMLVRFDAVLGLIDELQAVDTTGVEPITHVQELFAHTALRLRDDAVTEPDRRTDYQAGAPAVERGLYLVPRVIE